jgi:hypothetical protein
LKKNKIVKKNSKNLCFLSYKCKVRAAKTKFETTKSIPKGIKEPEFTRTFKSYRQNLIKKTGTNNKKTYIAKTIR